MDEESEKERRNCKKKNKWTCLQFIEQLSMLGVSILPNCLSEHNTIKEVKHNTFLNRSTIHKFSKIANWVKLENKQHHSNVLLNCFPMNGHV